MGLSTPVALLIFNRPRLTERVFKSIARVKPTKLFVVADGPRSTEEMEKCSQARAVLDLVDWDCEVLTNVSDTNLGCRRRVSSGLDWVFEHAEEAIILEDDCVPDPSFFPFCAELLNRYRDDPRIMMISGDNFQAGQACGPCSYYFSRLFHVWGWATWHRAWRLYDLEIKAWPLLRETPWLSELLGDERFADYWRRIFDEIHQQRIDTWDFSWVFSGWVQNGLAIIPNVNLVSNIGFGEEATHTKSSSDSQANLSCGSMTFPIQHPQAIIRDKIADLRTFYTVLGGAKRNAGTGGAICSAKSALGRLLSKLRDIRFSSFPNRD
jgi:hypothetical protein